MSRVATGLFAAILILAAASACDPTSPTFRPEASTLDGLPAGTLIRIDLGVAMASDNRTMTIRFIGGPVLRTDDVCYTGYEGWARLVDGHLDLAVVLVADVRPPSGTGCAAAGFERAIEAALDVPFLGPTAQDLSDGHLIEIDRAES